MESMRFKVGDRVRIKSLDWYNENKNKRGFICFDHANFIPEMSRYCGEILTINRVVEEFEQYLVSECAFSWTDEMIEGLVEEGTVLNKWTGLKVELELSKSVIGVSNVESLHGERFMSGFVKAIIPPEGYIFKDENGNVINAQKIVLEKKKKEYPKTFDKCCHVVQTAFVCDVRLHKGKYYDIFRALAKLIVCRDAYWKIAGEEMGLGKPWEPDWEVETSKYIILCKGREIQRHITCKHSRVLAFPTEEMRDAFYENFKELIEQCKELL